VGIKNTSRSLFDDMMADRRLRELVKDTAWAHKLYSALCNSQWQPMEVMDILRDTTWSASWRTSGGMVADLRDCNEDYMDWYCSGHEGYVHPDIQAELARLGWVCVLKDDVDTHGGVPEEQSWGRATGIGGSLADITASNEFLATKIEEDSNGSIQ